MINNGAFHLSPDAVEIAKSLPVDRWASEHADNFRRGFVAAARGEEYTKFQAESWKAGYRSSVSIFANDRHEYEEFLEWKSNFGIV